MRLILAGLLLVAATPVTAQTALQLRWQLKDDVFEGEAASRAAFTLTNRDTKPLGAGGWGSYCTARHQPRPGSVSGGFAMEPVTGDLQRLVPGPAFGGLPPGQSVEIEYRADLLTNNSFAPAGA